MTNEEIDAALRLARKMRRARNPNVVELAEALERICEAHKKPEQKWEPSEEHIREADNARIVPIKPCPFCGETGALMFVEKPKAAVRFGIHCVKCYAMHSNCVTAQDAVTKWNARAP